MGGWDGGNFDDYLSSTETLQLGVSSWRESTALPRTLWRLKAATLDNIIYITGEMIMLIVWTFTGKYPLLQVDEL